MKFIGISRVFSLVNEDQYNTIGAFWDELALLYGLENLQGLGYNWIGNFMEYVIGLKDGIIDGYNVEIELPNYDWKIVNGRTDNLKNIYDEIYKNGSLIYEIETFNENGECLIKYYR